MNQRVFVEVGLSFLIERNGKMVTATETSRQFSKEMTKDFWVLATFTGIYCKHHHKDVPKTKFESKRYLPEGGPELCEDCSKLLGYSLGKRTICPMDPKPTCRKCPNHCYKDDYREKMQEVMKFSGPHLIKRGRFDLLLHYLK